MPSWLSAIPVLAILFGTLSLPMILHTATKTGPDVLRFSLRTLLITTTLLAIALSLGVWLAR